MVIKIQTREVGIPVELGELKFTFDTSDESIKSFYEVGQKTLNEMNNVKDDDMDAAKEILEKGYDLMLGKGAFKKVYKQTPSLIEVTSYFVQIAEGIQEELSSLGKGLSQQDKAQQYLRSKNKPKNKNKK
ncbi:hypothetical protein [Lysinibacillus sp. NPDC093216]|uniref:hypothetical protein n=1 Tax=Lysinibacillus sp. NPDC093216 TaxID=3390576 RepID=UPI003D006AE1